MLYGYAIFVVNWSSIAHSIVFRSWCLFIQFMFVFGLHICLHFVCSLCILCNQWKCNWGKGIERSFSVTTFQYFNYNIYALVIIWAKEIKVWKTPRMHVTIGQSSAEIVPPSCLFVTVVHQPGSSSPPFQSICSVDIICMCEASSWSVVPLVPWHGPSLPSCRHTSRPRVFYPVSHWSSQGRPSHSCMEYTPRGGVSLSLVNVEQIVHPDWETAFISNFLQHMHMIA